MEDLHSKGIKSKNYRFCWVGNPGDQPLWNPKWHSNLSENHLGSGRLVRITVP